MGLFPEIGRAWITVDNRIYFWNYLTGSDFLAFEEIPHNILALKLILPKPDCFIDTVNYLMVVSTPLDIYMIAVAYDKVTDKFDLIDPGMVVSTKGLNANHIIASSKSGRIFFTGESDGTNVWEVVYSNTETWFRSKCTKICHTRSGLSLSYILPSLPVSNAPSHEGSFLSKLPVIGSYVSNQPEAITLVEIDDSRNLLYTLSNKSTVRVYHISGKQDLELCATYTLTEMLFHLQIIAGSSSGPTNYSWDTSRPLSGPNSSSPPSVASRYFDKKMSIVSITPVTKIESSQIHLVLITSTGCRLYARGARSGMPTSERNPPTTIQVTHIRLPPLPIDPDSNNKPAQNNNSSILSNAKQGSKIFEPGYFFCVLSEQPDKTADLNGNTAPSGERVFVAAPDSGSIIHQQTISSLGANPLLMENACFLDVEGFVQAICRLTPAVAISSQPRGFGNESAAQYLVPAPQIVILTNIGVHVYTRRYPYQIFENLAHDVRLFFDNYGRAETCANALSVASRTSPAISSDQREMAGKVYIEVGGRPHLKVDDENTYSLPAINIFGHGVDATRSNAATSKSAQLVRLSGRFDGLAIYLSRLLRDIWNTNVFKVTESGPGAPSSAITKDSLQKSIFSLGSSKSSLEYLQVSLLELYQFLQQNKTIIEGFTGAPSSGPSSAARLDELSLQAEHRCLEALIRLIKSMREGIAFLLLLEEETANSNNGIESIMTNLSEDLRKRFAKLLFKEFFTVEGTEMAKELVTCLVNRSITEGGSAEAISRVLQERCESYCSPSDVLIYQALEFLRKARIAAETDPNLKLQNLYESVRMFQMAAGNLPYESLSNAVTQLRDLNYHPGAVEIALAVSFEIDRGNVALGYIKDGKPPGDVRKEIYDKRLQIYQIIFDTLDDADAKAIKEENADTPFNSEDKPLAQLRDDTYSICYASSDETFHYCLYDWFTDMGLDSRLLLVETPYILPYLELNSSKTLRMADLLWIYHQKHNNFKQATEVLFDLAKSNFDISLGARIEFLSRAHGYCQCECPPQQRQEMVRLGTAIQEFLDVASVQDEILQRVTKEEDRFDPSVFTETLRVLNGQVLGISTLYNEFAQPLGYYEVCLSIFQISDFRGHDEIMKCWQNLIQSYHRGDSNIAVDMGNSYERVSYIVRKLGQLFILSAYVFPLDSLVPLLETYSLDYAPNAPKGWIVDTFLNAGVNHETMYLVLNDLLERKEVPFNEPSGYKRLASDLVYLIKKWASQSPSQVVRQTISKEDVVKLQGLVGYNEVSAIFQLLRW